MFKTTSGGEGSEHWGAMLQTSYETKPPFSFWSRKWNFLSNVNCEKPQTDPPPHPQILEAVSSKYSSPVTKKIILSNILKGCFLIIRHYPYARCGSGPRQRLLFFKMDCPSNRRQKRNSSFHRTKHTSPSSLFLYVADFGV